RGKRAAVAAGTRGARGEAPGPEQAHHERGYRVVTVTLAQTNETISNSVNEQRNAVHRSLYDGSQNQPLSGLRTNASGDRTLASHGQRGTPCGDGAVAGAHGRRRAGAAATSSQVERGLGRAPLC